MPQVIVAATQMRCRPDRDDNIARAESLVKKAVAAGSTGQLLAEADRSTEMIITAELDLERHKVDRNAWGFFSRQTAGNVSPRSCMK